MQMLNKARNRKALITCRKQNGGPKLKLPDKVVQDLKVIFVTYVARAV